MTCPPDLRSILTILRVKCADRSIRVRGARMARSSELRQWVAAHPGAAVPYRWF
jgi:hypothetical protein